MNRLLSDQSLRMILAKIYQIYSQRICDAVADQCKHILALKQMMHGYNDALKRDEVNKIYDGYHSRIVNIMDHFNHVLRFHDTDDDQFYAVFKLFGGECNPNECTQIDKHYRDRQKESEDPHDEDTIARGFIADTLAKIHCHVHHQYHFGFRLRRSNFDDEKYDSTNTRFLEMKKILRQRHSKLRRLSTTYKNTTKTNSQQILAKQ